MTPEMAQWICKDPREWPRCLSGEELEQEWIKVNEEGDRQPVSFRLLRAERTRRREEARDGD